jgi:hypothetical protein
MSTNSCNSIPFQTPAKAYMSKLTQTPIPRKITIGDTKYTIDSIEVMDRKRDMARIYYHQKRIEIAKKSNVTGKNFTDEKLNENFWHEVVHGILHDMGRHHLNGNEKFVVDFSKRLSALIKSAKF